MYIHTFGAIFGVACAWIYRPTGDNVRTSPLCAGGYTNQLVAFVGTIFLWMFWPSFNGALGNGN